MEQSGCNRWQSLANRTRAEAGECLAILATDSGAEPGLGELPHAPMRASPPRALGWRAHSVTRRHLPGSGLAPCDQLRVGVGVGDARGS